MPVPESDRCVLCLKYFNESVSEDNKTTEHVFPKSWYPDNTPENIEKWRIPSCRKCNNEHSLYEQELLVRLGLGLFESGDNAPGIIQKARRSVDPKFAKNDKDKRKRIMLRKRIAKDLSFTDQIPKKGILPNFGPRPDIKKRQPAMLIKTNLFDLFTKKIVRGLTFLWDNHLIENDYKIEYHLLHDEDSKPILEMIRKRGESHDRGPGIVVKRAVAYNDKKSSIYHIEVWGRLKIFGSVIKVKENSKEPLTQD